jgi:uncharacterized damage-inducible protein DinB
MATQPEPWMRGPIAGVSPLIAPILYTFQHAREDLADYTEALTTEQLWARPFELGSVGFHILHIAGSVSRLMTYLQGGQLSATQLAELEAEKAPPPMSRHELLRMMDNAFIEAERVVRAIDPATLGDPREVGRQRLPSTVIGLLTHIAEHTQRHVGQAISAAKLIRSGDRIADLEVHPTDQ